MAPSLLFISWNFSVAKRGEWSTWYHLCVSQVSWHGGLHCEGQESQKIHRSWVVCYPFWLRSCCWMLNVFLFNIRFLNFSIVFPCFLPIGFNHFSMGWEILSFEKHIQVARVEGLRASGFLRPLASVVGTPRWGNKPTVGWFQNWEIHWTSWLNTCSASKFLSIESSIYKYTHIMSRKSILDAR